jgi:hypothetical protein
MDTFAAAHVTRTGTLHLAAPPARCFPLFEPIGEKRWAAGWEPRMLYPASGEATEGSVFITQDAAHPGEPETIWSIVAYDPRRYRIAYVRVTPAVRLGHIDITCVAATAGTTRTHVTYTFTALSDHGNAALAAFTEEHYAEWMKSWEQAINHYLQHGRAMPHH